MMPTLFGVVGKATVVALLSLIAARLARKSSAAVRHTLLTAAFAVLLLLPIASLVTPPIRIAFPALVRQPGPPSFFVETSGSTERRRPVSAEFTIARWPRPSPSVLLPAGWFAGAIVRLLPFVLGLYKVRSVRRSARPWLYGQSLVTRLLLKAGIRRRIAILLHDSLPGPMTSGIVRPAIVFSEDAQRWDEEDLIRAMLHEMEHVRRRDWLCHCLARLVCAAYWFHPVIWIAWHQLSLEAERACDDAVIKHSAATDYAAQLVDLAQRLSMARKSPAVAMANRADLSKRVAAVLDSHQQRGRAGTRVVASACCVAAILLLSMSSLNIVAAPQMTVTSPTRNIPKFEVASIKRCQPSPAREGQATSPDQSPDRITTPCTLLSVLIDHAYVAFADGRFHGRTFPVKLEGLPAWASSDLYKIVAKADGTPGMGMMNGPMFQALLEDRFALKIHSETREARVYALTAAKSGLKLRPFRGTCAPVDSTKPPEPARVANACRMVVKHTGANVTFEGVMNLDQFASSYLSVASGLDAPVINETGISGNFQLHLEYASERRPGDPGYVPPTDDAPFPSVFTAVQEQLGLRLEAAKGPRQVLVVDHVERPSAN